MIQPKHTCKTKPNSSDLLNIECMYVDIPVALNKRHKATSLNRESVFSYYHYKLEQIYENATTLVK